MPLTKGEILRLGDSESPEFFRVQSLTPKKVVLKRLGRGEAESEIRRQGLEEKRSPAPEPAPEPVPAPGSIPDQARLILTPEEALKEAREIEQELDAAGGYGREF